jgi:DHA3 family macrolide efflux protein-like MFS transporter
MMIALIVVFYIGLVAAQPLYDTKYGAAIVLTLLSAALGFGVALGNMYVSVEMFNVIDKSYLARVSGIGSAISCAITPVAAFIIGIVVKFTSTQTILIIAGIIAAMFGVYMMASGSKAIDEAEQEQKTKKAQAAETGASNPEIA